MTYFAACPKTMGIGLKTMNNVDLDHPWINTVDQIGISGILIWAQIFLSAVLRSVLMSNWQKVWALRMCYIIAFVEFVAGCLLAWKLAPTGVVIATAIDLAWIVTIVVISIRRFHIVLRMDDRTKLALSADLMIRSSLYMLVLSVFYIGYLWARVVPKQVARTLYHPIALISLVPTLAGTTRGKGPLSRFTSFAKSNNSATSQLQSSAHQKPSSVSGKNTSTVHPTPE